MRITAPTYRPTAVCSLFTAHSSLAEIFAFSAKERDAETRLSYFGARYYSSDLSIWLSVDPMSGKYPHQSNYVYCSNNPLKVIDPNGEEEWELARNGTLTPIKNGRKDVDVVHATTLEGEAISRKFPANSINQNKDFYTFEQEVYDDDGKPYMKSCTTNYMHFSDLDVGYSFFEFAAENTSVEWAISSSDNEARVGTTSEEIFVEMPGVVGENESYHSHDWKHSGAWSISPADITAAETAGSKGVTSGIYMAGERQYYMLDCLQVPNGNFYLYQGRTMPSKFKTN